MRRAVRTGVVFLCACVAGVAAGELLCRTPWTRDVVGKLLGRGEFVRVVHGTAYFARDLERPDLATALFAAQLRQSPSYKHAPHEAVERELTLLQNQFADPNAFRGALNESAIDQSALRASIEDHLELRDWIEKEIATRLSLSEEECRSVYEKNRAAFVQPKRYRASHLFVAAPDGTAPEVVAEKRSAAQGLAVRLLAGESFTELAAEASEDEATKTRGGHLGYFSSARMPPEFIAELEKLSVGQTSAPFRSHLGFHIVQLTDVKPPAILSFEQARGEIALHVRNEKRATAVAGLRAEAKTRAVAAGAAQHD